MITIPVDFNVQVNSSVIISNPPVSPANANFIYLALRQAASYMKLSRANAKLAEKQKLVRDRKRLLAESSATGYDALRWNRIAIRAFYILAESHNVGILNSIEQ